MRKIVRATVASAVLALAAGCASAPRGPRLAGVTPPKLLGCSGYTEPARPWDYPNRFWIEVTVDERGQVLPGSGHRAPSHAERGGNVAEAIHMAESCHFTPADRAGEPVQGSYVVEVAF